MRRLLLVLAAAGAVAAGASAAPAQGGIVYFQMPSRNIGCAYIPVISPGDVPYLRCEIRSGWKPLPPRPRNCGDAVWGQAVFMTRRGKPTLSCIGDTIREPSAPVLAYGRTWRAGGFTCYSRTEGLRCLNQAGRGFFMSRERSYTF